MEKKISLLFIEKDGRRRAATAGGLQKHGFRVFSAADAEAGLELFRKNCFDMVLLGNSEMDDRDNLDFLDEVRKGRPETPVVVHAAHWSVALQLEALRQGAACCLPGPLKASEIGAILEVTWELSVRQDRRRGQDQRHRMLLENVPDIVYSLDSDGVVVSVNRAVEGVLGYQPYEVIGKPIFPLIHRDDIERIRRAYEHSLAVGEDDVRTLEFRMVSKSGEAKHFEVSRRLDFDQGRLVRNDGIARDVTRRNQLEEALRRERNFVSAVLETEGALVAVLDTAGRIVRFNRACEQTTGYSFEEIKGRPFWEVFLLPEETDRIRGVFEQLCAGCFPNSAENFWRTKNQDLRLISWSNTALVDASGRVEHIIATGIDITDHRRAEEELRTAHRLLERRVTERTAELAAINTQLRESEKRLRKQNEVLARLARYHVPREDLAASLNILTEAAAETLELERAGIWLYSEDFSRITCVDLFERSAQKHSGGQVLTAADYPDYFHALGEQRAIAADDASSDPRTREFTDSYLAPLGITSMLDAPIWFGGKMAGVICSEHIGEARRWTLEEQQFSASLADYVTLSIEAQHRRRAERELQQAHDELERRVEERTVQLRAAQAQLVQSEKMASLGMLVAGIAHEINTPVGAIHSMHDTLQRAVQKLKIALGEVCRTGAPETEAIGTIMKIIEDANRVIASGTGRVSDIVRRLRSFARLDEAELKRADIREGLEDTLVLLHHELKHGITVRRNYGAVPPFACYPGRLNQVFLNVLNNARQAVGDKGEICVSTYCKDGKACIEITDTGPGIPPEQIGRIFDPGFTTKGVGVGTGLGLSICYQIVRDHRGEIRVASEVGKGTTFTIVLPMTLGE